MYAKITTILFSNYNTAQKLLILQKHVTNLKAFQLSYEKAKLTILIAINITLGKKPDAPQILKHIWLNTRKSPPGKIGEGEEKKKARGLSAEAAAMLLPQMMEK